MNYARNKARWDALAKEFKRKSTTPERRKQIEIEARELFAIMWG